MQFRNISDYFSNPDRYFVCTKWDLFGWISYILALRGGIESRPEKRDILHFLQSLWSCRHCYCCSCCLQTILLHRAFVVLSLLSLCARLSRDGDATIEIQRGEQLREFWSRYPNATKRVKHAKTRAPIFGYLSQLSWFSYDSLHCLVDNHYIDKPIFLINEFMNFSGKENVFAALSIAKNTITKVAKKEAWMFKNPRFSSVLTAISNDLTNL